MNLTFIPNFKLHANLYALNFALLFMHEIDSAYWQEWNLFGLPGGIQLFLVINFFLFAIGIGGYNRLLSHHKIGYVISLILSFGGIFAFSIHSYFILNGHPEFSTSVSELLLILILIVSLIQAFVCIKELSQK